MMSVICTHCGCRLKVPDGLAGRQGKCPKCGNMVRVPIHTAEVSKPASPPPPLIEVSGSHDVAVEALRGFLSPLAPGSIPSNPFAKEGSHLCVTVEAVESGSAVLRYMLLSLVGRPRVTIRFVFRQNGDLVLEKTLSSSVFFQSGRDAGFRGGAFGGSNRSFVLTNCRKLARQVVRDVLTATGVPQSDQKQCYKRLGR
jgi:hypothetical protein